MPRKCCVPGCKSNYSTLTGQTSITTFTAIKHSTETLIVRSRYCLSKQHCKYVLLGKFQTDPLEARFGQCRQMSGGNYHISVNQVLESENKLKLLSLVTLKSAWSGEFQLKDFFEKCLKSRNKNRLNENVFEDFDDVLHICDFVEVSDECTMALIYVAGYVARGASDVINCSHCSQELTQDRKLNVECTTNEEVFKYTKVIDRGGLKWPTDFVVQIVITMYKIFQTLIGPEYEKKFLQCTCQRKVIKQLLIDKTEMCDESQDVEERTCAHSKMLIIKKIANIFANILLNNYCKQKNEVMKQEKLEKQKKSRKLQTLDSSKV